MTESLLTDGRRDRPQSAVVRAHHSKHSVLSEGTEGHYTQWNIYSIWIKTFIAIYIYLELA